MRAWDFFFQINLKYAGGEINIHAKKTRVLWLLLFIVQRNACKDMEELLSAVNQLQGAETQRLHL